MQDRYAKAEVLTATWVQGPSIGPLYISLYSVSYNFPKVGLFCSIEDVAASFS
jgi:hypothetical protein